MISATVSARLKPEAVTQQRDAIARRLLYRFGKIVRANVLAAITPSDNAAAPGRPPHAHTGRLERFTRYAVELDQLRVIIGPQQLGTQRGNLRALEEGGRAVGPGGRPLNFHPHPFMRPAFRAALRQLPAILK